MSMAIIIIDSYRINNRMKSYGLVIDQALQPSNPFHSSPSNHSNHTFPKRPLLDTTTESYSTVVEQAITTKDRPLLKEIIADSDPKTCTNTLAAIAVQKVPALLSLLEEFIYEDSRNTDHYCGWVKELIRQHLGLILSGLDNRPVVARLLKFVQRRAEERAALLQLKAALQGQGVHEKGKQFKPKFNYIQNQEKEAEEAGEGPIEEEEMDLDDDMLDQFDD